MFLSKCVVIIRSFSSGCCSYFSSCCCCCFVKHTLIIKQKIHATPHLRFFFWHRKNHQATQSLREPRMYATKPRRRAALSARQQLFHQSCGYTLATSFWFHLSRGGFLDPYKGYLYPREWLVEGISTYMKTHKNHNPSCRHILRISPMDPSWVEVTTWMEKVSLRISAGKLLGI